MIWGFVYGDICSKDDFDKFYDQRAMYNPTSPENQYLMNTVFSFVNWDVVARIGGQTRFVLEEYDEI